MTIHNLSEFINDDRFITKKQRATYLKKGIIRSDSKKAVCKAFERYYESCSIPRKKKGHEQQIELGDKLKEYKENDNRTSRQTTELAELVAQEIRNMMINLNHNHRSIENEWYIDTSFNYLFNLKLIDISLYHFKLDFKHNPNFSCALFEQSESEFDSNKQMINTYLSFKNSIWRIIFRQALNVNDLKRLHKNKIVVTTKNTYIDDDDQTHTYKTKRVLSDEEQAKYKVWEAEMSKRNDVEKPKPFSSSKNEKVAMYEMLQEQFIEKEFQANSMYEVVALSVNANYGEYKEVDKTLFQTEYKLRFDKRVISNRVNIAIKSFKYQIEKDDREYNENDVDNILEYAKYEIDKYMKLDENNNFCKMSDEAKEFMKEKIADAREEMLRALENSNTEYTQEQIIELIEKGEL